MQNLVASSYLWDDNNITIDGTTDLSTSTDQVARFAACGWHVQAVDGHDADAIDAAITAAKAHTGQPSFIAVKTVIGKGAPTKSGTNKVHGAPLGDEEIAATRKALNWDAPAFEIPSGILSAWRSAGSRHKSTRLDWEIGLVNSGREEEFNAGMAGDIPSELRGRMDSFIQGLIKDAPKVATRKASQNALEIVNDVCVNTIGGSADLTGSNNTFNRRHGDYFSQ